MTEKGAALHGIRVLELADEKGEFCGKLFADMGADVVKIEPPGGSPTRRIGPFKDDLPHLDRSLHFWHYNTSKRGITLNLETVDGREIFKRLVEKADLLIETFPPGYIGRLKLGYEQLSQINPRLVMVSITPFGQTGPYKEYQTTDLTALAMGGPIDVCGYDEPETLPVRGEGGQSYHVGGIYAFIGALITLVYRQMTGEGQHIDTSIHECLAGTVERSNIFYNYSQLLLRRQTGRHAHFQGPFPTPQTQYLCKDGRFVNISLPRDTRTWNLFVEWLDQKGMAADLKDERYQDPAFRQGQRHHISEVIGAFCAAHRSDEIFHGGQKRELSWGVVFAPDELLHDPHFRERGFWAEVEHPELQQSFTYPGAPYLFHETPWQISRRAPLLGEHNLEIYQGELGFSKQQLTMLAEGKVI
ncbi:MAG: CoA transferase [Candidatus Tectomicrobia bacterium]|nr:CoA transferase [Candidatus Tectomicrobia bacterium]